jgi:S-adenosylmethionine hydrolase
MKGVIYQIWPNSRLVDLYHHVKPQDVREGAWVLLTNYPFFPEGSIFLAVVDPGVGHRRQALIVQTQHYYFVGPDNGLLYPAVEKDGLIQAYRLHIPPGASSVFHGRDVFAPAAARLEKGETPVLLGMPSRLENRLSFYRGRREGEVVTVDYFGNIVTNLTLPLVPGEQLRPDYLVTIYEVGPTSVKFTYQGRLKLYRTYAEASTGELFLVEGSSRTLELSLKNGAATSLVQARTGMRVRAE